jgi:23S rRNA (cytidine1920-2'-O)/16S rRNA (cytidine1409-2'-O)-methyltransferase
VLIDVLNFAVGQGFSVRGLIQSPVLGPKGNVEFLAWLGMGSNPVDWKNMVDIALGSTQQREERC